MGLLSNGTISLPDGSKTVNLNQAPNGCQQNVYSGLFNRRLLRNRYVRLKTSLDGEEAITQPDNARDKPKRWQSVARLP
jgi:hypothetical protein